MSVTFYHCKIKDYGNGVQQFINYEKPIKIGQQGTISKRRDREQEIYDLACEVADGKKTYSEAEKIINSINQSKSHTQKSSTTRSKAKIYDLAQSNQWDWFITLTFDPQQVDRTNYDKVSRLVKLFLDETRRASNGNFKYLGVPEYHSDGVSYHFHFLFSGLDDSCFKFALNDGTHEIYNLGSYSYGWSTATRIRDSRKASGYITKYVTKEMETVNKGKKRYWASRNLNVPTETTVEQNVDTTYFPLPIYTNEVTIDSSRYKNKIKYEIFKFEES